MAAAVSLAMLLRLGGGDRDAPSEAEPRLLTEAVVEPLAAAALSVAAMDTVTLALAHARSEPPALGVAHEVAGALALSAPEAVPPRSTPPVALPLALGTCVLAGLSELPTLALMPALPVAAARTLPCPMRAFEQASWSASIRARSTLRPPPPPPPPPGERYRPLGGQWEGWGQ